VDLLLLQLTALLFAQQGSYFIDIPAAADGLDDIL